MISDPLARALRAAGLVWHPESGDRFRIEAELLTDVVFTLSDMTIEAHRYESGTVLGFNGTTEWALDSVDLEDALWLPREDQLRHMLGSTFRSLSVDDDGAYRVEVGRPDGTTAVNVAATVPGAYAGAVLELIALAYA
jgi:hypothetical protein